MTETKTITSRQLKEGQWVEGWTEGAHWRGARATVKRIGLDGIILLVWGDREERVSPDARFEVNLTDEEFKAKHFAGAKAVMEALCNRLAEYEIGSHEMCNSWLSYDPYEMAAECARQELRVLGYCTEIMPKRSMIAGNVLDVGICAEYKDGERIWCHYKSSSLQYTFKHFAHLAPAKSPWGAKEATP